MARWRPGRRAARGARHRQPRDAAVDALDALHGAAPTGSLPRRTRATEAAALAVAAEGIAVAGPAVERAARRLVEHLAAKLPAEPTVPHLLHGDFSIDQVVTSNAGAVLIDWDAACLGDPRLDLGSFLADLELRALDGRLASPVAETAAAMFAGENAGALRPFAAAGLLRRAAEPFRRRCPGWDALVEQAVERAAALTRSQRRTLHRTADAGRATIPRDGMLASLHKIAPPPGVAADSPLTLRRAWPRPDGRLLLEYLDESGRIVGAQAGLDRDAIAAEQRLAAHAGLPVPRVTAAGHRGAAASSRLPSILLHAAGADGRLPALHPLLARPQARLLAHRATRRAVVALDGTAYVKAVRPSRAGAVAAATTAAAGLAAGAFSVPAVLGADTTAGTVSYSPLLGRRLTDLLSTPGGADAMAALGAALRALHAASPPPGVALHDVARELDVIARATAAVAPYAPALAVRARRAAAAIERRLTRLAPVVPVPVHRDLHDKQVLVDPGGGLGLLDFDTLALGDPALDLGNLLAHLELRALQARCSTADSKRLAAALLDGYRADRGVIARAASYADATRVRLACVYAFRPAWAALPEQLLAAT
jgi:aminoglycoside phosphotransferase (APT) family kinase protein